MQGSMDKETDVTTAFEDILDTLPTALDWCLEHEFVDAPIVRREWYPQASTFSYHTISAIDNADQQTLTEVAEVSIGHALISDALEMGLEAAVRAYCEVLGTA